jgi:hypothetical protein
MERATTPPSPGRQRGITLLIALIAGRLSLVNG